MLATKGLDPLIMTGAVALGFIAFTACICAVVAVCFWFAKWYEGDD